MRTRASIIAIEPSLANVFYLTRSLRMLAARYPHLDVARRVVVFPLGAGDVSLQTQILVQSASSGRTWVELGGTVAARAPV